ncbi:TRAP transporter small permease [Butyricicoccus sp.]|uniref:TRAP transporter small permease n=1 Tax=Butyricicoccus sp. TaxID=2049021 RepID=UPI003736C5C6
MNALAKLRKGIDTVLSYACAIVFALMVCVGTYQVVARYIFNNPSTVSEELLTYSFTWMALLASALVFGKRDHMRMGFVADKLQGKTKLVLEVIIELLVILMVVGIMIFGGTSIVQLTMTQTTASLGIPMGIVYTIIPVSGVLIFVYGIMNIIDLCRGTGHGQSDGKE